MSSHCNMGAVSIWLLVSVTMAAGWPQIVRAEPAVVGQPAPGFTLTDADGRPRSLDAFKGRFVVLEWFNNECPFVGKHYHNGHMQRLQATYTARGVIWLTIDSSAPGKQGHLTPEQAKALIQERGLASTALLLDPDGAVGRRYGAKTTPHLFIIDPAGVVIYAGAIDDIPSTDPADVVRATNYVVRALEEADRDQTISIPQTPSYGCSVKY